MQGPVDLAAGDINIRRWVMTDQIDPTGGIRTGPGEPDVRRLKNMPLFPLRTVLFPGGTLPLRIFEPRYVDMVRWCMRESRAFGVVLLEDGSDVLDVRDTLVISQKHHRYMVWAPKLISSILTKQTMACWALWPEAVISFRC